MAANILNMLKIVIGLLQRQAETNPLLCEGASRRP